jgi:hypothetical protein
MSPQSGMKRMESDDVPAPLWAILHGQPVIYDDLAVASSKGAAALIAGGRAISVCAEGGQGLGS